MPKIDGAYSAYSPKGAYSAYSTKKGDRLQALVISHDGYQWYLTAAPSGSIVCERKALIQNWPCLQKEYKPYPGLEHRPPTSLDVMNMQAIVEIGLDEAHPVYHERLRIYKSLLDELIEIT